MFTTRWALPAVLLAAAVAGCTSGSAPSAAAGSSVTRTAAPTPAVSAPPPTSSPATSARPSPTPTPSATPSRARPVPLLSARARAAGLLNIRTIVPDAIVDLRYATSDNFTGVRLYPKHAQCLVHRSMRAGLRQASRRLRRAGEVFVFWDCYRPHAVQVHMFQIVPNPNWVARPGPYATSHEAGRSVDVTLAHASTGRRCAASRRVQGHCLLDMGTGFDNFTPRAYAYATDAVSSLAQANRARLRQAMDAGGLAVYSGEWWHFDGPGSFVHRPILGAPLH